MDKIKWGIVGLGKIAEKFCQGLFFSPHSDLYALASASKEKEPYFRERFQFCTFHCSFENLLADENVDCIYIATPNHLHFEQSRQALEAGKHVLCEKPLCLNVADVLTLQSIAWQKQLFFMEALWTRFLPHIIELKEMVDSRIYGNVASVRATFGFKADYNPLLRLFNPELGGGAVFDIGIYPLFLALFCLGKPQSFDATTQHAPTGCDVESFITLRYPNALADLACSFNANFENEAIVTFDKAVVRIPAMWHMPQDLFIKEHGAQEFRKEISVKGNGYNYEAEHVVCSIKEKKIESNLFSFQDSYVLSRVMADILRASKQ